MKLIAFLLIIIQVMGCSHIEKKADQKTEGLISYDPLIVKCENGDSDSCIEVGLKKNDALLAADFFKKACELKSEVGCGIIIFYLDKKSKSSKDLFARSCYLKKNKIGCHFLGLFYLREKQNELAKNLLKKSCEMGFADSCKEILRQAISQKDKENVLIYMEKACNLGKEKICFILAQYNFSLPKLKKALQYAKVGCDQKGKESCYFAGLIKQASGELKEALDFFDRSCLLRSSKGCYFLGKTLMLINKKPQAIQYLNEACDKNFIQACLDLANYYQENNLKNDAIIFFVKSCKKTEANSIERVLNCLMSAQYMTQFFDRKSSLELYQLACDSKAGDKDKILDIKNDACTRLAFYKNDSKSLKKGVDYSKNRCKNASSKKDRAYNCFSLACVLSLKNQFSGAILYLEKALKEKIFQRKYIESDFELMNIKNHSEFQDLLNSYF